MSTSWYVQPIWTNVFAALQFIHYKLQSAMISASSSMIWIISQMITWAAKSFVLIIWNPLQLFAGILWFGLNLPLVVSLYVLDIQLDARFITNSMFMINKVYDFVFAGVIFGTFVGVYTGVILISIKYVLSPKKKELNGGIKANSNDKKVSHGPHINRLDNNDKAKSTKRSELFDMLNQVNSIPTVNLNHDLDLNQIKLRSRKFKNDEVSEGTNSEGPSLDRDVSAGDAVDFRYTTSSLSVLESLDGIENKTVPDASAKNASPNREDLDLAQSAKSEREQSSELAVNVVTAGDKRIKESTEAGETSETCETCETTSESNNDTNRESDSHYTTTVITSVFSGNEDESENF